MDIKLRCMASIYITKADRMLLLYRIGSRVVSPSWCGIGGHFEPPELNDPKACVLRELGEEAGIREENLENIRLRYITQRLKNNEIKQNYYFFAELGAGIETLTQCDEGYFKWFRFDELRELTMPHTARHVIRYYLETGRNNTAMYCGAAVRDGVEFTKMEEF